VRRARQSSPGLSPAIFGRMCAALARSAALYAFLIYGFSLPAGSGLGAPVTVIDARPGSPQSCGSPQRAKTPERNAVSACSRPTPVVLPPPAPSTVAEPSTAPKPATAAGDPEPAAIARSDAASPNIPDPVYYPAKDLDIYPQWSRRIVPNCPQAAREAQVAGSVTRLVLIDEASRVVSTSVTDAAPDGVFEQAAQ
jgi:hypothetical protein